jgi:DNA polymerase-3 subunit epsilon
MARLRWSEARFCALDVETTGLDLLNDEIVSIGAVRIIDGKVLQSASFYREIRPTRAPSVASVEIHGLRNIDLVGAITVKALMPELNSLLSGSVLIAHAAWVERAFLTPHLVATGVSFPKQVIDTAALARACGHVADLNGYEPSLESLARELNLPAYAPHHALGDALTTSVVFLALTNELESRQLLEKKRLLTLTDLLKLSAQYSYSQYKY